VDSIALDAVRERPTAVDTLRRALANPSLVLVYRRSATGTWIDELGLPVDPPPPGSGRSLTPLERDGDWVAALVHDGTSLDEPERVRAACAEAAAAIEDERLAAELRAQVLDGQASRTRILAASDRQRRRVERNLHDGAQQRLVGLALTLQLAGKRAGGGRPVTELLNEAVDELQEAIGDLRELARGLHPAIVTDAGLPGALETLAEHPGIPVELSVDLPGSLPEQVEIAGYYLVAEALANANKHSQAQAVVVSARVADGELVVSVVDDGRGGAATSGSGLVGLADRLGALGGTLTIESEAGRGTRITGRLPLQAHSASAPRHLVDDILLREVSASDNEETAVVSSARDARWISGDRDRRTRALKWVAWQNHEAPGELIEAQSDEEDLLHAKALLLFIGGNRRLSTPRRDWVLGYLTTAGFSEAVLAQAAAYDDAETIEEILNLPRMAIVKLVILYDALRACAMAGNVIHAHDFDPVVRAADAVGIPRETVADLHEIVLEEARLRHRRHEIVVTPKMPKLLNDSIALTQVKPGDRT
jgi:signal transduction histidine kinase